MQPRVRTEVTTTISAADAEDSADTVVAEEAVLVVSVVVALAAVEPEAVGDAEGTELDRAAALRGYCVGTLS